MKKRYRIFGSGASSYEIGEYNAAGILAQLYVGYFDDKSDSFTLYPKKGGFRAGGVNVCKKKIHMSELM